MNNIANYFFIVLVVLGTSLHAVSLEHERLVTIHGIFGSPWNLHYLARPLENEKMDITHWGYPSRDKKIVEHASDLVLELQKMALEKPNQPIHFLTHSMGGLILRAALNLADCPYEAKIGKAVLIGPPNQGAAWGRMLYDYRLANLIGKEHSGKELMTENDFEHLGQFPETMDVMVIAGNFGLNFFIKEANDGVVAVSETHLTTPHHHVVIKHGHKLILLSTQAALLAKNFFAGMPIDIQE